jgi:hypothetical protein
MFKQKHRAGHGPLSRSLHERMRHAGDVGLVETAKRGSVTFTCTVCALSLRAPYLRKGTDERGPHVRKKLKGHISRMAPLKNGPAQEMAREQNGCESSLVVSDALGASWRRAL